MIASIGAALVPALGGEVEPAFDDVKGDEEHLVRARVRARVRVGGLGLRLGLGL